MAISLEGKARVRAFSPPRSGDDSPGSSKHAREKLEESHVAFGIDDGTIEVWDAGLRRFVERIDEKKLQTGVGMVADPGEENTATGDQKFKKANISQKRIQDMKYSQKGNFLAVGSHDNKIYVYRRKGLNEVNTEHKDETKEQSNIADIAGLEEGQSDELHCVCAATQQLRISLGF